MSMIFDEVIMQLYANIQQLNGTITRTRVIRLRDIYTDHHQLFIPIVILQVLAKLSVEKS